MATSQNSGYVDKRGSKNIFYFEVNDSGTPQESYKSFGIIGSFGISDTTDEETVQDAEKNTYKYDSTRTSEFTITTIQRGKDDLYFALEDYRGKKVGIVAELNNTAVNSARQYMYIPIAKVKPDLEFELPDGEISYTVSAEVNDAEITFDLACIASDAHGTPAGTVTVAADEYHATIEESV